MDLEQLPQYVSVRAVKKATRLDNAVDEAIAAGDLRIIRTKPNGWRRVRVSDVAAWLETLGPKGSETRAA